MSNEAVARALIAGLVSHNVPDEGGEPANAVDSLDRVADALYRLGNADAATPMGGLEAHGKAILDASEKIAAALHDVAEAIRESSRESG